MSAAASSRTPVGDSVVDGSYRALPDQVSDRMFSVLMSLTAEVWTVRDRIRLIESALADKGIDLEDVIEGSRSTPEQLEHMRADRDAFVERVFVALTSSADVEAP